jgi:CRP-like cAMP-binding protein
MKKGRPIEEWQRPLDFLAEAPLGWLIPHGQIKHFAAGATVGTGNQSADWAFLVLSGSCEQRRHLPDSSTEVLRTFARGETFGGFLKPDTTVVAAEDSAVFCIRLRDLADIEPKVNRHVPDGSPDDFDTARFTLTINAPKGKIVTLAFFSDALPEQFLAENIARRLHAETGASVMLVRLVTGISEEADCVLDEGFVLPAQLREIEAGLRLLRIRIPGEPPAPEVLGETFQTLRYRFDHVLLAVAAERVPLEVLFECIAPSRSAYFFLRRNSEDLYHLDLLLHELRPALQNRAAV